MRALWLLAALVGCPHPGVSVGEAGDDVWIVQGEAVTRAVWEARVAALVGDARDWSCAETTTGGITSYEKRDAKGVWWRVDEESNSAGPDEHRLTRGLD